MNKGISTIAGTAAQKTVETTWNAMGKDKPSGDDKDLALPVAQVIAFAVVSSAVQIAVSEFLSRKAKELYGVKPPADDNEVDES